MVYVGEYLASRVRGRRSPVTAREDHGRVLVDACVQRDGRPAFACDMPIISIRGPANGGSAVLETTDAKQRATRFRRAPRRDH